MAITVITGVVNKKFNSTLMVFDHSQTATSPKLKEPTSIQSPVLTMLRSDIYEDANYMHITYKTGGRTYCYWIDDVIFETNDIVEIHATLDALGTYRTEIGDATGFVNFGRREKWNKNMVDPRFSPNVVFDQQDHIYYYDKETVFDWRRGTVVLTVLSTGANDGSGDGAGVHTIFGAPNDFSVLLKKYSASIIQTTNGFSIDWQKLAGKIMGFGSAQNYIKSAKWIPISKAWLQTKINAARFHGDIGGYDLWYDGNTTPEGWYELDNYRVGHPQHIPVRDGTHIDIQFPAICAVYPWLKDPRYTTVQITTPGGTQDISTDSYIYHTSDYYHPQIYGDLFFVPFTGEFMYTVSSYEYERLAVFNWSGAVDLMSLAEKPPSKTDAWGSMMVNAASQIASAIASGGTTTITNVKEKGTRSNSGFYGDNDQFRTGSTAYDRDTSKTTSSHGGMSSEIKGMIKAPATVSSAKQIGTSPNNMCNWVIHGNLYGVYDDIIDFIHIKTKTSIPSLMNDYDISTQKSAQYEAYCDEYGYPIFEYGAVKDYTSLTNPYIEMAGCSVKGSIYQSALSSINSALNTGLEYLPRNVY